MKEVTITITEKDIKIFNELKKRNTFNTLNNMVTLSIFCLQKHFRTELSFGTNDKVFLQYVDENDKEICKVKLLLIKKVVTENVPTTFTVFVPE